MLEQYAFECAKCDCHRSLWDGQGRIKRLRRMTALVGQENCCWEGRRLPWFIAEGKRQLLADITASHSEKFQELILTQSPARQALLIEGMDALGTDLLEILTEQLSWTDKLPRSTFGAFYAVQGGTIDRSKELLRTAMAEYDGAVAAGFRRKLHRQCNIFFEPDSVVRRERSRPTSLQHLRRTRCSSFRICFWRSSSMR